MRFEPIIGLEVHAQLLTRSKIFCGCSTRFGAPPNSHTCPVCLGLPGSLPVTNREAVGMAIKAGLALGCRINTHSILARKNYFYPDLPKGYQISQYEHPLAEDGALALSLGQGDQSNQEKTSGKKRVGIIRVHLEEDAGKSIHLPAGDTQVNLNRCGVPLIEIVTHPDICSSQEASDFLSFLRRILLYLAICDGNMEEGSLRCDANVSVRKVGSSRLGTKVEIKNLNSFRFLQRALDFEIGRQIDVLEGGGSLQQETRLWDEDHQRTSVMRTKEEAHDYRYFPDPDLLPVVVPEEWLQQIKGEIPELPDVRSERFAKEYELSPEDALLITHSREFADYFERAVESYRQPRSIFNWMMGELTAHLKRDEVGLGECRIQPQELARLVRLVDQGTISGKTAKEVFEKMYQTGGDPEEIVAEEGLTQISDTDQLEAVVDSVLGSNPVQVQKYRDGKEGLIGFFVGQIMKETGGQANPKLINQMLRKKLGQ